MSAILDMHTLFAFENGYKAFMADQAAFEALFPGVLQPLLQEWYATLQSRPPQFRDEGAKGPAEKPTPWVIVTLADERADQEFLGHFGGTDPDTGDDLLEMLVQQDVRVTVLAWNVEVMRAIHTVLRAVALLATKSFMSVYEDWAYIGCDGLSPEEEMLCVDLGVFMRVQRYSAKGRVSVKKPISGTLIQDWFVQLDGVQDEAGELPEDVELPAPGAGETD